MDKKFEAGDIFLTDADHVGAKIVKFLMISPTIWHWLVGIRDEVRFYHAGMCVGVDRVIEQQRRVEFETVYDAILKKKAYIVWRKRNLTEEQKLKLLNIATADLGEGYDILLIFGKLLTWITGIKWFVRNIESKNKDICITRVGSWFFMTNIENFGKKTWHELTTDVLDNWCLAHPNAWEIVAQKI